MSNTPSENAMNTVPRDSSQPPAAPRGVAISGVLFAVLYFVSLALIRLAIPVDPADPGDWLRNPAMRNSIGLALNLVPFAGITFLWFMGALRNRIGQHEDRFFATVFLGSGLLFVAMLFVAAAVARGLVATFADEALLPRQSEAFRIGRELAYSLTTTYGTRMAAVFMFVTSSIGLRTAALSRPVSVIGFAIGLVLLLFITTFAWIALLFPVWVLLVSAYLLVVDFRSNGLGVREGSLQTFDQAACDGTA